MTTLAAIHAQVRSRGDWIGRWEAWLDRPEYFVGGSWIKQAQNLASIQTRQETGSAGPAPRMRKDWTRFAAEQATGHAFSLLQEELGLQKLKSSWSSGIGESQARKIFQLARRLERPGVLPLSEDRQITFQELLRRLPRLRGEIVQPDFHSAKARAQAELRKFMGLYVPKEPGRHHQWWEARSVGFFQRYGTINPLPISVAKRGPGSNFDFSVISDGGQLIVVEVMAGGWEAGWPSKRKLAERFAELGVTTIFVGAPPPWECSDCHPSPRRLWTPSGVITVDPEASDSASSPPPFGPGLPGVYYLPEPELCDLQGKPLLESILASSA